jgi:hypothetical protein
MNDTTHERQDLASAVNPVGERVRPKLYLFQIQEKRGDRPIYTFSIEFAPGWGTTQDTLLVNDEGDHASGEHTG